MDSNFSISQANELLQDGKYYDLHNRYDFSGLTITQARHLQLCFTPNTEHGEGLPSIVLEVSGLDFLELSPGFGVRELRDLAEIGYKNPADRDLDWLVAQERAKREDHLVLWFDHDDYVRVHGQDIRLREVEDPKRLDIAAHDG